MIYKAGGISPVNELWNSLGSCVETPTLKVNWLLKGLRADSKVNPKRYLCALARRRSYLFM